MERRLPIYVQAVRWLPLRARRECDALVSNDEKKGLDSGACTRDFRICVGPNLVVGEMLANPRVGSDGCPWRYEGNAARLSRTMKRRGLDPRVCTLDFRSCAGLNLIVGEMLVNPRVGCDGCPWRYAGNAMRSSRTVKRGARYSVDRIFALQEWRLRRTGNGGLEAARDEQRTSRIEACVSRENVMRI